MRSHLENGAALLLALAFCSAAFAEPKKTGDDDDIDDLIIERAENATADKARRSTGGSGLNETEDDLYVGSKPQAAAPPDAAAPSSALTPASGNWGEFVTVSGKGYGSADGVQVRLYPNDDDSQPATMRQTATLYSRQGADAVQIQIPQDPAKTGWSGDFANGVVRVYVYMPGQLEPVLAGRYTVGTPVNRAALRAGLVGDLRLATRPTHTDGNAATTAPDPSSSDAPAVGPSGLIPGSTLNAEINSEPGSATPDTDLEKAPLPQLAAFDPSKLESELTLLEDAPAKSPLMDALAPRELESLPSDSKIGRSEDLVVHDDRRPLGDKPADFVAQATGPTSVEISWREPAVQAQAYRVVRSRSGAPPEELPQIDGTATRYSDKDLMPLTTYSYTLTADYGLRMQPGVSDDVSVTTTMLMPPSDFTIRRKNSSAIELSWTPRPEATGYEISRNGNTFRVTGASYDDTGLQPGDFTYAIRSILKRTSGTEVLGANSNALTLRLRPFRILAAGDSVMWGQGLSDNAKFTYITRDWIRGFLPNKAVDLMVAAHSGAIIERGATSAEQLSLPGELPVSFPSISRQVLDMGTAQADPRTVDLILLDGCINDVGVVEILAPALIPVQLPRMDSDFAEMIERKCAGSLGSLLYQAGTAYPNATFVITGYFPMISDKSGMQEISAFFSIMVLSSGGTAAPVALLAPVVVSNLVHRSRIFKEESTKSINRAVSISNRLFGNRFLFADAAFTAENALGGPAAWLANPPIALDIAGAKVEWEKDAAYDQRVAQCDVHNAHVDFKCKVAAMGHPNVAGAAGYGRAIQRQLSPLIANWALQHSDAVTDAGTPVYSKIEFVGTSAKGGTLRVLAADWRTGVPVEGTVLLDGQSAGAIGTEIPYAYRAADAVNIAGEIRPTGYPSIPFSIPARRTRAAVSVSTAGLYRSAVVNVVDVETGQSLQGTFQIIDGKGRSRSAATGQSLRYDACFVTAYEQTDDRKPVQIREPIECIGTVSVPYYANTPIVDGG